MLFLTVTTGANFATDHTALLLFRECCSRCRFKPYMTASSSASWSRFVDVVSLSCPGWWNVWLQRDPPRWAEKGCAGPGRRLESHWAPPQNADAFSPSPHTAAASTYRTSMQLLQDCNEKTRKNERESDLAWHRRRRSRCRKCWRRPCPRDSCPSPCCYTRPRLRITHHMYIFYSPKLLVQTCNITVWK